MWSWPNTLPLFLAGVVVLDSSRLLWLQLLAAFVAAAAAAAAAVVLEIPSFAGGFVLLAASFRQDFLCWQRLWDHGKVFGVLVVLCSNVMCLPGACSWVFGVAFWACCVVSLLSVLLLWCSLFAWFWFMSLQQYSCTNRGTRRCATPSFLARIELAAACLGVLYMASFVHLEEPFLLSGLCGCVASGRGVCWAQDTPQLLALLKGWQASKHIRGRATVSVFALRVGAGTQK